MLQHPASAFARASEGSRHHYIPVFYLRQWIGADGRLCQYSRPYDQVKALRKHPKGTGYERGLHNIPGLPPQSADLLERNFMALADDWAARGLQTLLSAELSIDFEDIRVRAGWARFLYSLILRTPEYLENSKDLAFQTAAETVDHIKEEYQTLRQSSDPPTFEEFRAKFLANPANITVQRFLHKLIDSPTVVRKISDMRWFTVRIENSAFTLLTSDRPVIMTNGLAHAHSHIVMPISPIHLFVAVNTNQMARRLRSMKPGDLARRSNNLVSEQARRFVYGIDDSQLYFVSRRLGKMVRSSPLD